MNKTRIERCFAQLKQQQRSALIPYIMTGDPDLETTLQIMHTLIDSGADIIELGIPFSDPMSDGPVIELAHERALAKQVTLRKVLDLVAEFRQENMHTPIILMGYLNPLEIYGYTAFAKQAQASGVDGVLLPELLMEEAQEISQQLAEYAIKVIQFIAPTTSDERLAKIAASADGYLYYIALKGVTGSADLQVDTLADSLARIRKFTQLPISVGFGIRNAASAQAVGKVAEGIVIGTALVQVIAEHSANKADLLKEVADFIKGIRKALD